LASIGDCGTRAAPRRYGTAALVVVFADEGNVGPQGRAAKSKTESTMFLPQQYFWLEPVVIAAVVVFVIDLIGNTLSFSNRFMNALVTAMVFAVVFGSLVYFGYGNITMSVSSSPSATAPAKR
jgi:hypothetical protein